MLSWKVYLLPGLMTTHQPLLNVGVMRDLVVILRKDNVISDLGRSNPIIASLRLTNVLI